MIQRDSSNKWLANKSSRTRIVRIMENLTIVPVEVTTESPPNYDIDKLASEYTAYQIGFAIHQYYYPILAPIGVIGNMLSLIVMLRKRNRELSFCVYLAALAVTDTLVMFSSLYIWSGLSEKGGEFGCMMVCLTFQTSSGSSIGLIFFINFDRYLATCQPFCRLGWRQRKRAVIVTIVIGIVSIFSGIIFSFTSAQINPFTCAGFATGQSVTTIILVASYLIVFAVLPISAVIALNLAIAKVTKRRLSELKYMTINTFNPTPRGDSRQTLASPERIGSSDAEGGNALSVNTECQAGPHNDVSECPERDSSNAKTGSRADVGCSLSSTAAATFSRHQHGLGDDNDNEIKEINLFTVTSVISREFRESGRNGLCCVRLLKSPNTTRYHSNVDTVDQQVSRTLLLVTIAFFILVLPQFLRYFIYMFINFKSSPEVYATYILIYQISQKLCATNSAINFFIYCIKGSRFRKDFFDILKIVMGLCPGKKTDIANSEYIDDLQYGGL